MKYLNHDEFGIVIFPESTTHAQVAARLGGRVISDGFVDLDTLYCYGKSVSLNLNAEETDSRLLASYASV